MISWLATVCGSSAAEAVMLLPAENEAVMSCGSIFQILNRCVTICLSSPVIISSFTTDPAESTGRYAFPCPPSLSGARARWESAS